MMTILWVLITAGAVPVFKCASFLGLVAYGIVVCGLRNAWCRTFMLAGPRTSRQVPPQPIAYCQQLSAQQLNRAYREGMLSVVEVVETFIQHIQNVNPYINAMVFECFDEAMETARRAEATWVAWRKDKSKPEPSWLLGVPCTIKECMEVIGCPNSSGHPCRKDVIAVNDSPVVRNFREAGAIILGVTNTSELCMWYESSNYNYGITCNPFDTRCLVGGSSGGEGAAAGAVFSTFSIGSDIGGSIRMPAYFNGVYGHKASPHYISNLGQHPGAKSSANHYMSTGPITRFPEDLIPLSKVAAQGGFQMDPKQFPPCSPLDKVLNLQKRPLRVYALEDFGLAFIKPSASEVEAVHIAAEALREHVGAEVTYINVRTPSRSSGGKVPEVFKPFANVLSMWSSVLTTDPAETRFSEIMSEGHVPPNVNWLAEAFRWLCGRSGHTLPAIALSVLETLERMVPSWLGISNGSTIVPFKAELEKLLGDDAVIIAPTFPKPAPRHHFVLWCPFQFQYTAAFNVLQLPATACPVWTPDLHGMRKAPTPAECRAKQLPEDHHLPKGVQIVSSTYRDELCVSTAIALNDILAFVGDLKTRKVMAGKGGVSLSILTSEDMARVAFVEVRTRCGQEDKSTPWLPVTRNGTSYATFYDTRMGNFDVRTFPSQTCSTCTNAQTGKFGNERCNGHFGYISMPRRYPNDLALGREKVYVINPHLAEETEQLLQGECFFCHRFRVPDFDVQRYQQALRLMDAGLIGDALHLLDVVVNSRGQTMRNKHQRDANEEVINEVRAMCEHVDRILSEKAPSTTITSTTDSVEEEEEEEEERRKKKSATDIRNGICRQALREFREYTNVCTHCHCISPRITTKNGHLFFFFSKKNADFNVANGALTQAQLRDWEMVNRSHKRSHTYYYTSEVREHIKALCQREADILGAIFPHLGESAVHMPYPCPLPSNLLYKAFFLDKVLVPPLPLRLSSGVQVSESGVISPDDHTRGLSSVLDFVEEIETYFTLKNRSTPERNLVSASQEIAHESNLRNLQATVTEVYTDILEGFAKKEGLFRMHMMGKRVNQACRSVISPDPLVEPNEVLLPRPFARQLTFPEQVGGFSSARTQLLKQCVINGPNTYPGATHLEVRLASGEVRFVDLAAPEQTRRQHAVKYFALAQAGTLIVHRHILDGDRLIFNRQPTLHKASMMGYRAKVLSGLKTLRFHYVNGKSYNADFDGDEMNIHVPQSIEAKAELECLMDANLNYLVPTSGKPIRGLIQDHIVAGVLLTLRDKFLDRDTFVQYLFNAIAPYMRMHSSPLATNATLTEAIPVPAILLPHALWTGKQLISSIVRYVTGAVCGKRQHTDGVSLTGTSLVQPSAYATTDTRTGNLITVQRGGMDDDRVLFLNSELLTGVLCKNQLGPANLSVAHVIHEIFGPHMVGELFGAFGRVLTLSLQREGFSMGMDDMCLVMEGRRAELLRELDNTPLNLPSDEAVVMPAIMTLATRLQKEFVPGRMLVPFPHNQLLMMTMSGAKGSNTNAIQMALGLGQQLFDGRRVRQMNSGKTLPAFFIGEKRARSFGYAIGRFSSGIRPPEYTIHAMAGRDGLIDTAVKTSRSGHLQRCLIKGMESLIVHWDHSVRDANGSVIQFIYGGDGIDPMKASTLQAWEMTKENVVEMGRKFGVDTGAASLSGEELITNDGKRHRCDETEAAVAAAVQQAMADAEVERDPLPAHMKRSLHTYLASKASYTLFRKVSQVARWGAQGNTTLKLREKHQENVNYYGSVLEDVAARRRVRSYCEAGEPVGLLAAQAAGEPSTQMTLNTFHSAGSTVTHVTEGIPRLRELLIHASVQKSAVIVPVERAREVDEVAISRILSAGVATKLADCLACGGTGLGAVGKGYHFHVTRTAEGGQLVVALLFSKALLERTQEHMCMTRAEHVKSFTMALRAFAKQVVAALRGRTRAEKETGAGLTNDAVQDPKMLGAALGDDDDDEGNANELSALKEDEDEDRSTQASTPAFVSRKGDPGIMNDPMALLRNEETLLGGFRNHHGSDDEDDDSDDDEEEDGDENGEAGDAATSRRRRQKASRRRAHRAPEEEDGDDDDELVFGPGSFRLSILSHDTFDSIQATYGNKFQVEIAPLNRTAQSTQLPDDLFIVNVGISLPPGAVAVIPDVLDRALSLQTFSTWLPQFDSISFTRNAGDSASGEMVFQGPTASMRNVMSFLSLFTVRARAIKTHKARSTDIQQMCLHCGVESGYRALLDELDKLFRRYAVDYHHLTLIADSATHRGKWENFNYTGVISHSASPLFQMTFASSKRFLHTAVTRGIGDELNSISSAIMVGERPRVGTACVKVTQDTSILRDIVEKNIA